MLMIIMHDVYSFHGRLPYL